MSIDAVYKLLLLLLLFYLVCFFFQDVFYLTQDELYAFVDGRSVTNNLMGLVELRKKEYDDYRKVSQPKRLLVK